MNRNILGAICLSVAASLWGGMYVVSKYVRLYPADDVSLASLCNGVCFLVRDSQNHSVQKQESGDAN